MKFFILPYRKGSKTVRKLAQALKAKVIKLSGSHYKFKPSHILINWGGKQSFSLGQLNLAANVMFAVNKSFTFTLLDAYNVPTLKWTDSKEEASKWQEQGYKVVARTTVSGQGGNGVVICQKNESLPHAPLYTRYQKKQSEYRVHVFKNKVIFVQEKRKRRNLENVNSYIRNWANGWVFCHKDIFVPEGLTDIAVNAINALGLDFGAVDLLWSKKENLIQVIEVNTAPGLEGRSLEAYINQFQQLKQEKKEEQHEMSSM